MNSPGNLQLLRTPPTTSTPPNVGHSTSNVGTTNVLPSLGKMDPSCAYSSGANPREEVPVCVTADGAVQCPTNHTLCLSVTSAARPTLLQFHCHLDLRHTLLPLLIPISISVYDLAIFRAIHVRQLIYTRSTHRRMAGPKQDQAARSRKAGHWPSLHRAVLVQKDVVAAADDEEQDDHVLDADMRHEAVRSSLVHLPLRTFFGRFPGWQYAGFASSLLPASGALGASGAYGIGVVSGTYSLGGRGLDGSSRFLAFVFAASASHAACHSTLGAIPLPPVCGFGLIPFFASPFVSFVCMCAPRPRALRATWLVQCARLWAPHARSVWLLQPARAPHAYPTRFFFLRSSVALWRCGWIAVWELPRRCEQSAVRVHAVLPPLRFAP
ncbi:hypothetical protein C8J57DRAFT_1525696 [Mycena rebaudengoi]|nr:hypothetical protein C8J57DRAFT_1525696 [Mycena rebaudengoi]